MASVRGESIYFPPQPGRGKIGAMSIKTSNQPISVFLRRWGPALVMMAIIFFSSSLPSQSVPDFGKFELTVKKGGHALGYLLLGRACLYGFRPGKKAPWLAWGLCILYAITDEIHQSFVPGRSSRVLDVGIDTLGALLGLLPAMIRLRRMD
jgi:VanZ family protein